MLFTIDIGGEVLFAAVFFFLYVFVGVIDVRTRTIPDAFVAAIVVTWLTRSLVSVLLGGASVSDVAVSAVCAVVLLAALLLLVLLFERALRKPGMGGGDIKLLAVSVLVLGPQKAPLFLFVSCLAGLCLALVYRAFGQREFPLGPALAFALILTYFY